MPELPEVEVCRRDLARWTAERRVVAVDPRDPAAIRAQLSTLPSDALAGGAERLGRILDGARTHELVRHGKRIGWRLRGRRGIAKEALLLHLGMTGRWVRRGEADEPGAAVRLRVGLDDGSALWFEDSRRFGCVVPVAERDLDRLLSDGHGPDALLAPPDVATWRARLRGKRPVKVALMDQAVVAGIGNIHAAEALWRTRIPPSTVCDRLTDAQIARLAATIPGQMREFVEAMDAEGEHAYVNQGGPNPFDVYDREGEPCRRCGAAIVREVQAGRSTFWCPGCQVADAPDVG